MSSSPFLNFIRNELRLRGYSLKTEKFYLYWIKYFIRFHQLKHPQSMGAEEVRAFLSFLAVEQCLNETPTSNWLLTEEI